MRLDDQVVLAPCLTPRDADLDLVLEVLYAPLFQRWLHRSGPLTTAYADSLVDATLRAFGP
ncbi:TetR-like C-terminal domain-containing protein [Streptomyces violens]|uniref:TetR-like C-terminal domain-containing protein n=1 Tax=Streptomyces violens TaxID=66377 RepID=UPI0004C02220|nr:TetR-like C-terminal domain-containing protein [Streptomyces violens]